MCTSNHFSSCHDFRCRISSSPERQARHAEFLFRKEVDLDLQRSVHGFVILIKSFYCLDSRRTRLRPAIPPYLGDCRDCCRRSCRKDFIKPLAPCVLPTQILTISHQSLTIVHRRPPLFFASPLTRLFLEKIPWFPRRRWGGTLLTLLHAFCLVIQSGTPHDRNVSMQTLPLSNDLYKTLRLHPLDLRLLITLPISSLDLALMACGDNRLRAKIGASGKSQNGTSRSSWTAQLTTAW